MKKGKKQTLLQKVYIQEKLIYIIFSNQLALFEILAVLLANDKFMALMMAFQAIHFAILI